MPLYLLFFLFLQFVEDDFDSTVLEQIIPPSQTGISTTYTFNVSLRPDNVLEETEAFVIFLNITSENVNDVVESSRMCAVIKINEPSFTGPRKYQVFHIHVMCALKGFG